jgi:hypothetical protein
MKGKREELRIPMKFDEAVSDFLKVKSAGGPRFPHMVFRLSRIQYSRVPRVSRFSRPG